MIKIPDFTSVRILSLDEAFVILDKIYQECIHKDDMEDYILSLNAFLGFYKNTDKILKLKSYQYTVEVRKSTKIFKIAIYTENKTPTTYLSDEQIKRLHEFNDYLNTPEALDCLKSAYKFMYFIVLPIALSIVVLFIFFVIFK